MAYKIPKIEWLGGATTGNTTNNSPTITGMGTVSGFTSGMLVRGAGIPFNARIVSIGVLSVTLDKNATATASGVALEIHNAIIFEYQPIEKKGRRLDAKERVATSISGRRQVSIDYIEEIREFIFSFLTQALHNQIESFYKTHALYGRSFNYFEDQLSSTSIDYELYEFKFDPQKISPKGPTDFVWNIPIKMRRDV